MQQTTVGSLTKVSKHCIKTLFNAELTLRPRRKARGINTETSCMIHSAIAISSNYFNGRGGPLWAELFLTTRALLRNDGSISRLRRWCTTTFRAHFCISYNKFRGKVRGKIIGHTWGVIGAFARDQCRALWLGQDTSRLNLELASLRIIYARAPRIKRPLPRISTLRTRVSHRDRCRSGHWSWADSAIWKGTEMVPVFYADP